MSDYSVLERVLCWFGFHPLQTSGVSDQRVKCFKCGRWFTEKAEE